MTVEAIIISDIHVGAGELDDFDSELEDQFVKFFDRRCASADAIELVINGDFLDFVQAEPWRDKNLRADSSAMDDGGRIPLCFTESQSVQKLNRILAAHPRVFDSLSAFLEARLDNRLIINPGNHDADFFWPKVRRTLVDALAKDGSRFDERIEFNLSQVYRPRSAPFVWIEHGHQYDTCNSFFIGREPRWDVEAPPILDDAAGVPRLIECVGTRFLNLCLNYLDKDYPFVDNVKPFSRFVNLFLASAVVPNYGPVRAAVAVFHILAFLSKTLKRVPSDILGVDDPRAESPREILLAFIERLSPTKRNALRLELIERGCPLSSSLELALASDRTAGAVMDGLARNIDLLDVFEADRDGTLGASSGTLHLTRAFNLDETKALEKKADAICVAHEADCVVMGHTHEVVNGGTAARYFNPGSWTRNLEFTRERNPRSWTLLKRESQAAFPFELNYVSIRPDRNPSVLLETHARSRNG